MEYINATFIGIDYTNTTADVVKENFNWDNCTSIILKNTHVTPILVKAQGIDLVIEPLTERRLNVPKEFRFNIKGTITLQPNGRLSVYNNQMY